jgi:hypothetical protein
MAIPSISGKSAGKNSIRPVWTALASLEQAHACLTFAYRLYNLI